MSDEGDETAARNVEETVPDPDTDRSATDADADRPATDADRPATDADGPSESTDEPASSEDATPGEGIPADERPSAEAEQSRDRVSSADDEPSRYYVPSGEDEPSRDRVSSADDAPSTARDPSTERVPSEREEESFSGRTRSKSVAQVELDEVRSELVQMRDQLEAFESEVEDRTVTRSEVESDLKRYVRRRMRRGRARGWGPYIVLLYGTAMTIGAFYYLEGGWAILAMIVLWLSTLGLYVLMVLVGAGINALMAPLGLKDRLSSWRS